MAKQRLDSLLVEMGLAETRSKAQAIILAGDVLVDGAVVDRPGKLLLPGVDLKIIEKPLYVGRGGLKLAFALHQFRLNVDSYVAMDIGASTGGFTDCLLQHGAARVYAIDVGYGQLDYSLRKDPRVVVMERVNAHYPFNLPEKVNLTTMDLSFISTTKVIPNLLTHLTEPGYILVLFKPQFEARRDEVGKKGVITDPLTHARTIGRFIKWVIDHHLRLRQLAASPILGAEGNKEFLVLLQCP